MEWFYAKHGQQQGPVDLETLKTKFQSGEIAPTDLVWREGMGEWVAAETLSELTTPPAGAEPAPSPQAAVSGTGPEVTGEQAVAQPAPGMASGVPQGTPGLAIASLVCGIIGICGACCYGLGIFPCLAAVICGHMQMKRYKETPGEIEQGKGLVMAGLITGYLGILLSIVMVVYFVVVISMGVSGSLSAPPSGP